jgi:ribonuclease P protein component
VALPRANRLRRREDFNRVYQKGFRKRSRHLTLVVLKPKGRISLHGSLAPTENLPPDDGRLPTRVGISISQKVSKRAVIRNRIKRQIRAAMGKWLPLIPPGWDLVIVVHPQAGECDYFQFLRELEQLLMAAEVLNGHS